MTTFTSTQVGFWHGYLYFYSSTQNKYLYHHWRAYILIMMFISKIIYIMKEMFVLCGKTVGIGGKLQKFCFSLATTGGLVLIR